MVAARNRAGVVVELDEFLLLLANQLLQQETQLSLGRVSQVSIVYTSAYSLNLCPFASILTDKDPITNIDWGARNRSHFENLELFHTKPIDYRLASEAALPIGAALRQDIQHAGVLLHRYASVFSWTAAIIALISSCPSEKRSRAKMARTSFGCVGRMSAILAA